MTPARRKKKTMSRPFGVALLIGGIDPHDGPVLYNTDPSGRFAKCSAWAIGSAQEGALSQLLEQYNKDMTMTEAEILAMTVLRQGMEDKMTNSNVEVATVTTESKKFKMYTQDELAALIERLPARTLPQVVTGASAGSRQMYGS